MHFSINQKGDSNMRIPFVTVMLSTLALGTVAWADDTQVTTHQESGQIPSYQSHNTGQVSSDLGNHSQSPGQISSDMNNQDHQSPGQVSTTPGMSSNVDREYTYDASSQSPGTSDDTNLATTAEASDVTRGYLNKEMIGLKPQVGVMAFTDQLGNSQGRAAYGFTLESNIASMIGMSGSQFYIGPETGFIYSHFGDPGSNFFGSNSDTSIGAAGANVFIIPADLKVAYNVTDRFRVGAHGGGNVLYRSIGNAFNAGPSSSNSGSVWKFIPMVVVT